MKALLELIKNSWKLIVTVLGAIGIIGTIFSLSSLIATADDVKKTEANVVSQINTVRNDTAKSIIILNDKIELQGDIQRLKNLDDISVQLSIMIQDNPNKKLIKQQEKVDKERDILLDKILKSNK